jgi:hypothetical protein
MPMLTRARDSACEIGVQVWRFRPDPLNVAPGGQAMSLSVVGIDCQRLAEQIQRQAA